MVSADELRDQDRALGDPAFERGRELQLMRPSAWALLVEVLDRLGDLLHRGRLLGRLLLEPLRRLIALDHRVNDEQGRVDVVLAQLRRLSLDERAGGERGRRPGPSAGIAATRRAAGDLNQGALAALDQNTPAHAQNVEDGR